MYIVLMDSVWWSGKRVLVIPVTVRIKKTKYFGLPTMPYKSNSGWLKVALIFDCS